MVVDFPESTWPITTTLMCIFSLLQTLLVSCTEGGGGGQGCWSGRCKGSSDLGQKAGEMTYPMLAVLCSLLWWW